MVRKLIQHIDAEVHYEDIPEMNWKSAIDLIAITWKNVSKLDLP